MPQSGRFLTALRDEGYDFYTGVPCSLLRGVFHRLETDAAFDYVPAVREDSAVGLAAGAHLAGRRPVVLMQNSGLGVCLNALASLNLIYEIPSLVIASWRGQDGTDAPEHWVMGRITTGYFDQLEIPWHVLSAEALEQQVGEMTRTIAETHLPGALIVPKGLLDAAV